MVVEQVSSVYMLRVQNKNLNLAGHVQKVSPYFLVLTLVKCGQLKVDWPCNKIGQKMANG